MPLPLGSFWDGSGTRFAVHASGATKVELCLFATDASSPRATEIARVPMERHEQGSWSSYRSGIQPGQLYGYRVHGSWNPAKGLFHDPQRLLVDPYARAISDGFLIGNTPPAVVIDEAFEWGHDRRPGHSWSETVIYECHVRGMTRLHPGVPEALRGTYCGLTREPVLRHLRRLGVTAVQLMPIQHFLSEPRLRDLGLSNYWGYNTLGFFAPHAGYSSTGSLGGQVREFKEMVRALHRAGFEIFLDVVYNHTAEGDPDGPTLCFRGLDNHAYYRLQQETPELYENFSGCGNTLDGRHPVALDLIVDSLRYWVCEMHVDGFRFDLAPSLGRDPLAFDFRAALFRRLSEDPDFQGIKWIAEPWDLGPEGYQLGRFPEGWAEWNDRYRDGVRSWWRGDSGRVAEIATRLAGSSDTFSARRGPLAGVNFASCHDGFTLADLVRYEKKHNEANGEENRDGHGHNLSRNWGAEGPSSDPAIRKLRSRAQRALLATLALSLGVPMLGHGDELGRTQRGNNNAYCQDNEIAWVDWNLSPRQRDLLAFTRRVFALRRRLPRIRTARFLRGPVDDSEQVDDSSADVFWRRPDGQAMTPEDWQQPEHRTLGMLLPADSELSEDGPPEHCLLLLNAGAVAEEFHLPRFSPTSRWRLRLDTGTSPGARRAPRQPRRHRMTVLAHSFVVLTAKAKAG